MNDLDFNAIIIDLSDKLESETLNYLNRQFKQEEDSDLILNLVLSAHTSSLVNIMRAIAQDNEGVAPSVNKFIKDLLEFVSLRHKIEITKFHRDH